MGQNHYRRVHRARDSGGPVRPLFLSDCHHRLGNLQPTVLAEPIVSGIHSGTGLVTSLPAINGWALGKRTRWPPVDV